MKFEKLAREILGTGKTVRIRADSTHWNKRGGYADAKLKRVYSLLDRYGFKMLDHVNAGTPDGSTVTNGRAFASPNGEIKIVVSESYGVTADSNRFSVEMTNVVWGE